MPQPHDFSIGIDFGTSNTVVAIADSRGHVEALTFEHGENALKVYVTALCFWEERHGNGLRTRVEGGPWAIDQFLEGLDAHRFIQSFKTFAASATFKETRIFRERYGFEDLLSAFLRTLVRHGGSRLDWGARNVIIGRPSDGSVRSMPAMFMSQWAQLSSMRSSSTTTRPCSWPISAAAPATSPSCAFLRL